MSVLKEKSSQNLTAAQKLLENHLYSSSIHCSYYSCVQLFLHTLFTKLNYDPIAFNQDARNRNTGTHVWASKLIDNEIIRKDKNDYKWFQRVFPEFKKMREKADYTDEMIQQAEGYDAIGRAQAINNLLIKLFK